MNIFFAASTCDHGSRDSSDQHNADDKKPATEVSQVPNQDDKEKGSPNKTSKKVIKHALRQQAKRRRKNTTIAAGGGSSSVPILRMNSSPNYELEEMTSDTSNYRQPTMAEILSSIPGFNLRVPSRKRSNKKLSAAAQIEQTREGSVDLESSDSILVNTNLRQLLNCHTFPSLPQLYQYKLLQLLPHVDRVPSQTETMYRLSSSGLNNEFFARACLDWRERLSEGEFTPENQAKLKAEQEKEKSKLDPWKVKPDLPELSGSSDVDNFFSDGSDLGDKGSELKHFEPMWGESLREWPSLPPGSLGAGTTAVATAPTPATPVSGNKMELSKGMSLGNAKTPKGKPAQAPTPVRNVGAVTRAVTSYREKKAALECYTKLDTVTTPSAENEAVDIGRSDSKKPPKIQKQFQEFVANLKQTKEVQQRSSNKVADSQSRATFSSSSAKPKSAGTLTVDNSSIQSRIPLAPSIRVHPSLKLFICAECDGPITQNHFCVRMTCTKCTYQTCCANAIKEHNASAHPTVVERQARAIILGGRPIMSKTLFCGSCLFSSANGNKMATHLALCDDGLAIAVPDRRRASMMSGDSLVKELAPRKRKKIS